MNNLPDDIARCDGLLPKNVRMPSGAMGVLWSIDCKQRETCARFVAFERDADLYVEDGPELRRTYPAASHGPDEACPTFVQHEEGGE